jgi:hypothetical protein
MTLSDETRAMLALLDDYARFRARTCERAAYQSHDVAEVDETLRTEAKVWMEVVALAENAGDNEGPFSAEIVTERARRTREYYDSFLAKVNDDEDAALPQESTPHPPMHHDTPETDA